MRRSPDPGAGKQEIFECIDSIGVGFEIVQCHCVGWDFSAAMAISDGGLHSKLIVGELMPVRMFARDASELESILATATVELIESGRVQAVGSGSNVLGSPLSALSFFFEELYRHSGALSDLHPYLITTGSWTNPLPIMPGQRWSGKFSHALGELAVQFG
jgi:2-oxo-3-hexenedioate decarboxylase